MSWRGPEAAEIGWGLKSKEVLDRKGEPMIPSLNHDPPAKHDRSTVRGLPAVTGGAAANCLAWAPSGRRLAVGDLRGAVHVPRAGVRLEGQGRGEGWGTVRPPPYAPTDGGGAGSGHPHHSAFFSTLPSNPAQGSIGSFYSPTIL